MHDYHDDPTRDPLLARLERLCDEIEKLRHDMHGWFHEAHKRGGLGEPVEVKIVLEGTMFDRLRAAAIDSKKSENP